MRVGTSGIVAFSTDDAVTVAAFALSSRLFVADPRRVATRDGAAGLGARRRSDGWIRAGG